MTLVPLRVLHELACIQCPLPSPPLPWTSMTCIPSWTSHTLHKRSVIYIYIYIYIYISNTRKCVSSNIKTLRWGLKKGRSPVSDTDFKVWWKPVKYSLLWLIRFPNKKKSVVIHHWEVARAEDWVGVVSTCIMGTVGLCYRVIITQAPRNHGKVSTIVHHPSLHSLRRNISKTFPNFTALTAT